MHRTHRRVHVMTHTVPDGAQLVEGLDVEPGAFITSSVQHHPHGVLLQQSRQTLVHCQIFVALQVEELSGEYSVRHYRQMDKMESEVRSKCS